MEKKFNPVIRALQSLRKLRADMKSTNEEIRKCNDKVSRQMDEAGKLIVSSYDTIVINLWLNEKTRLKESSIALTGILQNLEEKFKNKDCSDLTAIWNTHNHYKKIVINTLEELKKIGDIIFISTSLQMWEAIWKIITLNINRILSIAETYKLKLAMMEALKLDETDPFTKSILKRIPWNYLDRNTYTYDKEYLRFIGN